MRRILKQAFYIGLFITTIQCANQTAPTGGPKDEDPPELVISNPTNGELNVSTKTITLEFNEYIKANNAKEQIIITPRLSQEYEVNVRKNKLLIELSEPLSDSTTYTINIREGVKDITENNPPDNLKIAFSTGSYLDSLSITGIVNDQLLNKLVDDFSIYLYDASDTIDFFNGPPLYLTKTNEQGEYILENLKSGIYNLFAIKDKNNNFIADVKSETYGFYSSPIVLDSSHSNVDFTIQKLDVRPIQQISARQNGTTYEIKYNKNLKSYHLEFIDSVQIFSAFTDQYQNSIRIYNPQNIQDSLLTFLHITDSVDYQHTDTLFVKFEETSRSPLDFNTTSTLDKIVVNEPIVKSTLTFTKPVAQLNHDSLYVYIDSLTIIRPDSSHISWNYSKDKLEINMPLDPNLFATKSETDKPPTSAPNKKLVKPDTLSTTDSTQQKPPKPELKPHLYFGHGTFISPEADTSQIIKKDLSFTKPDAYGTILVEVETSQTSYIIQLLNKNNEVVDSKINPKNFSFTNVTPGDYKLRVLIDSNKNGKWDPGNILEKRDPEPVIFYLNSEEKDLLTIRANWELGPNIIKF
ncbi:MAG: Ig-like domain-containing protein [Fulvivirga sp.]